MKIDIDKKYRTIGGEEVEYLHRAPEAWPDEHPWRGIVNGTAHSWSDTGKFCKDSDSPYHLDLIEVREPREWQIRGFEDIDSVYTGPSLATGEIIRVREIID